MIDIIKQILIMLLTVSTIGYILVVLKEKLYLNKNTIVIDKKSVTSDHINEADITEFLIGNIRIRSGDEVSLTLSSKEKFNGIIIGGKKSDNEIILVTHKDEIKQFKVNKIRKIKIVSKYGKFF